MHSDLAEVFDITHSDCFCRSDVGVSWLFALFG